MPWPSEGQRRASVNSFGVGGANAHVILDDALHYLKAQGLKGIHNTKAQSLVGVQFSERSATNRELPNSSTQNGSSTNGPASSDLKTNGLLSNGSLYNGLLSNGSISNTTVVDDTVGHSMLFNLSAADEDGVRRTAALIEEAIRRPGCDNFVYLQNLAYTLSTKRSILAWRAYAVGATSESLQASLHSPPVSPVRPSLPPIIHFVFTGQGAQWPAMGLGLMVRFDAFRKSLEWSDNYFRSLGSAWSLISKFDEFCTQNYLTCHRRIASHRVLVENKRSKPCAADLHGGTSSAC
jgi:acyl transferase domain-containing protein